MYKYRAEWKDGVFYEFDASTDKVALYMVKELRKTELSYLIKIVYGEYDV